MNGTLSDRFCPEACRSDLFPGPMETLPIALSTRWNAGRHMRGEEMIEEILELGFDRVELGYDTRLDLVPGIQDMIRKNAVHVDSVHNYCPVPMVTHRGHPEIFTLADPDHRIRELAIQHTGQTIRFAAEIGARVVITHCGNVKMPRLTEDLITLARMEQQFSGLYEKTKHKLVAKREKKSRKQLQYLSEGLERLLPVLEEHKISLALENLPTWESIPTETEMESIARHYNTPHIRYWHDIGHGQTRENLGLINHERWLERLQPFLAGMHLHDVAPPVYDHLMPPDGKIDFARFQRFAMLDVIRVIEPTPQTPREVVERGLQYLKETWGKSDNPKTQAPTTRTDE